MNMKPEANSYACFSEVVQTKAELIEGYYSYVADPNPPPNLTLGFFDFDSRTLTCSQKELKICFTHCCSIFEPVGQKENIKQLDSKKSYCNAFKCAVFPPDV